MTNKNKFKLFLGVAGGLVVGILLGIGIDHSIGAGIIITTACVFSGEVMALAEWEEN